MSPGSYAPPPLLCVRCRHLGPMRLLGEGPDGQVGADRPCLLLDPRPESVEARPPSCPQFAPREVARGKP